MNRLIQCKITILPLLIAGALACFGLLPKAEAVVPAPDGGYPGGNTAEGQNALLSLNVTTGTNNTAVGWFSLRSNVEGQLNTAVGAGTLFSNTAHGNTAIGGAALFSNTAGIYNTAVGLLALFNNATGNFNTANGFNALNRNINGTFNTANGAGALFSNTSGDNNTANGYQALFRNTVGDNNTAIGVNALFSNTDGDNNTAIGTSALSANTDGDHNTATGYQALLSNTTGGANTAYGRSALWNNTTGSGNIALGFSAGSSVTTANNVICIGAQGQNVANSCFINNIFDQAAAGGIPVFVNSDDKLGTTTSSKRFKEEIKPMEKTSEGLFGLKPVTFRYRKEIDPKSVAQFGLVAEEVEKVNPDLVVCDKGGKPYSVRYDQVNVMLLNEFLKEHRKNEEQEAGIALLQKQIEALTAGLQKVSAQLATASPSRGGLEVIRPAPQTALNNP